MNRQESNSDNLVLLLFVCCSGDHLDNADFLTTNPPTHASTHPNHLLLFFVAFQCDCCLRELPLFFSPLFSFSHAVVHCLCCQLFYAVMRILLLRWAGLAWH